MSWVFQWSIVITYEGLRNSHLQPHPILDLQARGRIGHDPRYADHGRGQSQLDRLTYNNKSTVNNINNHPPPSTTTYARLW